MNLNYWLGGGVVPPRSLDLDLVRFLDDELMALLSLQKLGCRRPNNSKIRSPTDRKENSGKE
jgi:hypothetical protein